MGRLEGKVVIILGIDVTSGQSLRRTPSNREMMS